MWSRRILLPDKREEIACCVREEENIKNSSRNDACFSGAE
jgi:hypothetical protein